MLKFQLSLCHVKSVGFVTVTIADAVKPFCVFAVILAVPIERALIFPLDTVAILLSLVDHVTVCEIFLGSTVFAVSVLEFPLTIVTYCSLILIDCSTTAILQVAVLLL